MTNSQAREEKQAALLLDKSDTLCARLDRKRVRFEPIKKNSAGKGASEPEMSFEERDLPLAFGPRMATSSPGFGLKAHRLPA